MNDTLIPDASKTPGIVIFTAILNFITAFFSGVGALVGLIMLVFGGFMSAQFQQMVNQAITTYPGEIQSTAASQGLIITLGVLITVLCGVMSAIGFFVGRGLLKGRRTMWYVQIAFSVMGLFAFPVGTALNLLIMIFFFQPNVRNYFKV